MLADPVSFTVDETSASTWLDDAAGTGEVVNFVIHTRVEI
jgi:hypothetical protein